LANQREIWNRDEGSHEHLIKKIEIMQIILADQREIWNRDEGSHANTGHVTKTAIFPNSRWRKAAILKTVFGVYVILVMN